MNTIQEVAERLGLAPQFLVPYGHQMAKVELEAREAAPERQGKLVLVSAITPAGGGEGKTTVSIGLAQGLAKLGMSVALALREPSLGPTFGKKGGATGGGRSTLVPAQEINLHFTGDMHAVTSANNLLAALLDNHIHHNKEPRVDPRRVYWRRVMDMNDRALRDIVIGLGGVLQGVPRETGFDITSASEIMATLCLAEDQADLRKRLARIVLAETFDGEPFTAADLDAVGALMALLKDALKPNLVQTCEGVPAFVHGGPFANIAHGCNSVIATKMAMAYADWTVTEAGFGFALGAEKFFDIKCRTAGLDTAAVILVATVESLKRHGGIKPGGEPQPNPKAVLDGLDNLRKHIESIQHFGEPPVVAINRFETDTEEEIAIIESACEQLGVPCAVADIHRRGGEGGVELARAVVSHAEQVSVPFKPLYEPRHPFTVKLERIAVAMYGAGKVTFTAQAKKDLAQIERYGYGDLPLCVAKTERSLSGDPHLAGRPRSFELLVSRVLLNAGAGYLVPVIGDIRRMPGLPSDPLAARIDLTEGGRVEGLMAGET